MEEVVKLTLTSKIIGGIVAMLIITLNSIEIHMLRSTRNKVFYEKILLSLTICDLITGVYATFAVPFTSLAKEKYHVLYWIAWAFLVSYCTLNSVIHLIIIGIDRLWAIASPLHHRIYASNRKLFGAIAISWFTPSIYIMANITIVTIQKLDHHTLYSYTRTSMAKRMAQVLIIADIVLVISYSAIIIVIWRQKTIRKQSTQSKQRQFISTITLCTCIALVFVTASTPYVVVHIVDWNKPLWLQKLSIFLFPMNQILNSVLYMMQKIRTKGKMTIAKKNQNVSSNMKPNVQDTRL